jgi:RimJ/RimL family protein N-acetyltransferase
MFPPPKIITGTLEIREFGPQDAPQVTAFLTAGDRTALPPQFPADIADVDRWLTETVQQWRRDGNGVHLVLVNRTSGEIVGSAGLRDTDWTAGSCEIGYGVRAGHRGRGYATEAARAIGHWALTDGGMRRVQLHAHRDNVASVRVAERAGYHCEATEGAETQEINAFSMPA